MRGHGQTDGHIVDVPDSNSSHAAKKNIECFVVQSEWGLLHI